MAIGYGICVKRRSDVLIATRYAMQSTDLLHLRQAVEERSRALDEHEREVRTVLARLEANFVQRFLELKGS